MSDNFQVNKQFAKFKGKDVLIGLKNDDGEGLKVIKGGKIAFISIQE